jgi:hypothetical protein
MLEKFRDYIVRVAKWLEDVSEFARTFEQGTRYDLPKEVIGEQEIQIHYQLENEGSYTHFKDPAGIHSFRTHHLELGDDQIGWHLTGQREGYAEFRGYEETTWKGKKSLRGRLTNHERTQNLGVIIKNGRVQRVESQEEKEAQEELVTTLWASVLDRVNKGILDKS